MYFSPRTLRGLHNLLGRPVQHFVVVAFHADTDPFGLVARQSNLRSPMRRSADQDTIL